jgi:peptide/nickel transport system substrate-binding protein
MMNTSLKTMRRLGAAAVTACALATAPAAFAQEELPYGPDPAEEIRGGVLTVGSLLEPPALDPFHQGADARIQVTTLIYQGLFYEGMSGPVPLLATGYQVSDDGLTYTFPLRQGVKFHTGQDMTAADVKYSYDYIRNPDNGSPGAGDFSTVESIDVVDDYTVVFNLSQPNASLPMTLGNKYGAVVPTGTFDDEGARAALNRESVGTGPFRIAAYETNSFLELVAFEDYWQDGMPYLDGITFLFMPNNAALLVALRNQRIDFAKLGRPQDSEQLAGVDHLEIQRWASLGQKPLDLDSNYGPLQDVRVRQAIALAVDKEEILQASLGGYGTVIHTIVAGMQDTWGVPVEELEFQTRDLERARALMAEAGLADGVEMDLTTIAGFDWMDPAAVTLKEQLSEIGITLNIKRVDLGVWIDNFRNKNMGLTFNDWATQPDPNMLFFRHFHKSPEGADFRNWNNEEASALLREGRSTSDPAKRKEIYAEFQKILDRTVPTVMLFSADIVTVANERVKNLYQHPTGWYFGLAKTQVEQ